MQKRIKTFSQACTEGSMKNKEKQSINHFMPGMRILLVFNSDDDDI